MSTLELEEGDTGEALLPAKVNAKGVHADRDGSERPRVQLPAPPEHRVHNHDLDPTCRETRNQFGRLVGECLKASRARTPSTEVARDRDAEDSVPTIKEYRTEWGVMFHDGSVRCGFNGRTARLRASLEAQRLAALYAPDNIRLVSRPVFVGAWVEPS